MNTRKWMMAVVLVGITSTAQADVIDTASCDGKRGWQRHVVREAVQHWMDARSEPEDLIALVQAEHGIVACNPGGRPRGLHTTTLPAGLRPEQLGGLLLANELAWRGLVPPPEVGLAGMTFRVRPPSPEADRYDAYAD